MAINLNPGADATLVGVAYRAGMATAPADYSKTFENVAKSYEKTMEAQGQMWKDIGDVVGVIGADMVANAQEWNNYKDVGEENAAYLVDELEVNKQAQKDLGLLPSILGNKETRDEKRRLKRKQKELFAEIDFVAKSLDDGAEAVAAGLFDENLAPQDAEIINAIIKSNLKDKITESGFQTVLSRDEKTDQLVFNLLDRDGNPVTSDATGDRLTMTMKEFNKSIATHVKDTKNVIGTNMSTIENEIFNLAKTSKSGVIDEQMLQMSLNKLDGLLQTDVDVRRAMQAKYGFLNTSFADDIKTKNKVSEEIYASLIRTIGVTKDGQVIAGGVFGDIADNDNKEGLSQEEINNAYGIYSANILGMKDPEVSKAVFKASYADRMRDAHVYGYGQRKIVGDGGGGGGKNNYGFGSKSVEIPGMKGTWVSQGDRNKRRDHVENNEGFRGVFGDYEYDVDLGGYILEEDTENPMTKWDVMQQEQIVGNNDRQVNFDSLGVQKSQVALNTAGEEVAGGVTLDLLDGSDNTVASSLNSYIPSNSNYSFRPAKSPDFGEKGWWDFSQVLNVGGVWGEDVARNAVELVDGNNNPIKWKGKRLLLFTSSGGGSTETKNAQDAAVANFNDWLSQQNDFELQTGGNTGVGASEPGDVNKEDQ